MPTFDFDTGSLKFANAVATANGTGAVPLFTFTDTFGTGTGITFTVSVVTNGSAYALYNPTDQDGNLFFSILDNRLDTFLLQAVTDGGKSEFVGPVTVDIATTGGPWTLYPNKGGAQTIGTPFRTAPLAPFNGTFTTLAFVYTPVVPGPGTLTISSLTVDSFACFTAGTWISTPEGPVPVEALREGDVLSRADGGTTRVRWLGWRHVDTRFADPAHVNPICIKAGALGPDTPSRDLWLSADHALWLDGYLVHAGALLNGDTIARVPHMPAEGFTYYHIET